MATKDKTLQSEIAIVVDPGNSQTKFTWDELSNRNSFPNLIAKPIEEDKIPTMDGKDPIDFLDMVITSPSIDGSLFNHVYVGKRAMAKGASIHEIVGDRAKLSKAERQETIVTIIAAAAYSVAQKHRTDIQQGVTKIRSKVKLGVGLPVGEYSDHAEAFAEKLAKMHTVEFRRVPIFEGITIELDIELPDGVAIDDVSAAFDIEATSNNKLSGKQFGIADIGGVDMDVVFFNEGLDLDVLNTYAGKIHLNDALDAIRKKVNENKELLKSTAELVDRLVRDDLMLYDVGLPVDIRPIVVRHLTSIGARAYEMIKDAWGTVTYAREIWLVGGGAVILAPYITQANVDKRPIYFDDTELSRWRNLRGTFIQLKGSLGEVADVEAAVSKEE